MPFPEFRRILGRLLGYVLPYWRTLGLALLCTVLAGAGQLSQAGFVGLIFGIMAPSGPPPPQAWIRPPRPPRRPRGS